MRLAGKGRGPKRRGPRSARGGGGRRALRERDGAQVAPPEASALEVGLEVEGELLAPGVEHPEVGALAGEGQEGGARRAGIEVRGHHLVGQRRSALFASSRHRRDRIPRLRGGHLGAGHQVAGVTVVTHSRMLRAIVTRVRRGHKPARAAALDAGSLTAPSGASDAEVVRASGAPTAGAKRAAAVTTRGANDRAEVTGRRRTQHHARRRPARPSPLRGRRTRGPPGSSRPRDRR
jgi:hypothetical protein